MENIDYTQDYSEMVLVSGKDFERLRFGNGPAGFGYQIFDRKTKKMIYHTSTKEKAAEAVNCLREGRKVPSTEGDVFSSKILILKEKHSEQYILVPDHKKLLEISIKIIKSRLTQNYYYKPTKPNKQEITQEDIDKFPEGKYKEQAKKDLLSYVKELKDYNNEMSDYSLIERGCNGDGNAAWAFLSERSGYQYEEIELIEPDIDYHG